MAALTEFTTSPNINYDIHTIKSTITDKRSLLHVLKDVLNSTNFKHLDEHIDVLKPYVKQYNLSRKDILQLSHVFCKCCGLYKPAPLNSWSDENPELFDTEIFIFDKFFKQFTSLKKNISIYPLEQLFIKDRSIVYEQSVNEKLKILNTIIAYYDVIINYQI